MARHRRPPCRGPRFSRTLLGTTAALIVGVGLTMVASSSPAHATIQCPAPYAFTAANNIYLRSNCSNTLTQLTTETDSSTQDVQPALSPSGSEVLFIRIVGLTSTSAGTRDVWVMPTQANASPVQITHLGGVGSVGWSPDGQHIVLSDNDSSNTEYIYTGNADGSGLVQFNSTSGDVFPAWCGDRLVVERSEISSDGSYVMHLYTLNANDGSNATRITNGTTNDLYPACSPDGHYVFYASYGPTGESINVVPITGGAPVQLTAIGGYSMPTVAADWTLAYVSFSHGNIIYQDLGGSDASGSALDPSNQSEPSFAQGMSTTPPPAGFPIAYGSPSPSPSPSGNCPTFQFFGVRGSGEKQKDAGGYGSTVASLKNNLAKLIPGMAAQPIDYPAIGIDWTSPVYVVNYANSVDAGAKVLFKAVTSFVTACPTTYYELGGLSQGADVIDQVYSQLTDYQRQRALVVEFGSPRFNPGQPAVDYGTYNPKLSGILIKFFGDPPAQFPSRWAYRIESYCAAGDPVCNYSVANLAACAPSLIAHLCIHQLYGFLGFTADGAKYSYRLWKALPKLK